MDAVAVTLLLVRLRPTVLRSGEVRFALRAFCCARAGDYVRFFRLAAGASYLQACILHGAFPQVTCGKSVPFECSTRFSPLFLLFWPSAFGRLPYFCLSVRLLASFLLTL